MTDIDCDDSQMRSNEPFCAPLWALSLSYYVEYDDPQDVQAS